MSLSNVQLAMCNDSQPRKMKYSGVEWIGDIPEDWETSTINSLYSIRNEKVSDSDYPPLSVTMKGIVPQLETAAKTDAHDSRKLVKKGDFAINSRSDRRGSCGISDYDGSVSLINTVLQPREEMNPIYYNWLFHSSRFSDEFYRWGHGIVDDLWTTRWQKMRNITIPSPTLPEQQAIADILDRKCTQIDALIANEEQQIAKLKAYKQSVITETVTKGLDPDVPMKDSGVEWIGEIPEHWNTSRLKNLSYIVRGGSPRPAGDERYYIGSIPFMKISDITKDDNIYVYDCINSIKEAGLSHTRMVEKGTLLLTNSGATLGVPKITMFRTTFNDGIAAFLNLDVRINIIFAYYSLKARTKMFLESASMGMGQPNLNTDIIGNTIITLPSIQEQEEIILYLDQKCEQIDRLIAIKQQKIEKLQQYKKSVIYEYVTGKKHSEY